MYIVVYVYIVVYDFAYCTSPVLGYDTCKLWSDIEELIIKTMLAITPELKVAHKLAIRPGSEAKCFQILGLHLFTMSLIHLLPEHHVTMIM